MEKENIKCHLREIRIKRNLSQTDIAIAMNVKQTTVSEWENNNNIPNLKIAYKLSELLEVNVTDIWKQKKTNQRVI